MERQDFGDLSPGAGLFPAAEDALSRERLLREEVWKMRSNTRSSVLEAGGRNLRQNGV